MLRTKQSKQTCMILVRYTERGFSMREYMLGNFLDICRGIKTFPAIDFEETIYCEVLSKERGLFSPVLLDTLQNTPLREEITLRTMETLFNCVLPYDLYCEIQKCFNIKIKISTA